MDCEAVKTQQRSQPKTGLARALSKLGYCSRSQAFALIREGCVAVDGVRRVNPEHPVDLARPHHHQLGTQGGLQRTQALEIFVKALPNAIVKGEILARARLQDRIRSVR